MTYVIERNAPEVPADPGGTLPKSPERIAMESLDVCDAFMVDAHEAMQRARWIRHRLRPKKFTVRKVGGEGWQVRRVE